MDVGRKALRCSSSPPLRSSSCSAMPHFHNSVLEQRRESERSCRDGWRG